MVEVVEGKTIEKRVVCGEGEKTVEKKWWGRGGKTKEM